MAIGFRAAGAYVHRAGSDTSTLSVGVPAGTASGDLMLLVATSFNTTAVVNINTPAGWTAINAKNWQGTKWQSVLYYKVAGASEGSVSMTTASASYLDAVTLGFTGVDATTPLDVTGAWGAEVAATTVTVPSITTQTANAWWVTLAADSTAVILGTPSGWTDRCHTSLFAVQFVAASVLVAAAGATLATSYSRSGSTASLLPITIALRESGASAGSVFVPQIVIG